MIERGPPIAVYDRLGFPETDGKEIEGLKSGGSTPTILPHILEGSKTGKERQEVLDWMLSFMIQNEVISDDEIKEKVLETKDV